MRKLDGRLNSIRELRNRVFHHERIIHWKDLDAQHAGILQLIGWISPELCDLALSLDRYAAIRKSGEAPWIEKLRQHWPNPAEGAPISNTVPADVVILDAFNATNGAETPFGHRWGGDVIQLSAEHLAALQAGQTLALDVQNEYVVFIKTAESAKLEPPSS